MSKKLIFASLIFCGFILSFSQDFYGYDFDDFIDDPEFELSLTNDLTQALPDAAFGGSKYLVVWHSSSSDGDSGVATYGRFLSSTGVGSGSDFIINDVASGDQREPSVSYAGSQFVATWSGNPTGDTDSGYGIYCRSVSTAGSLGTEYLVNTFTTSDQRIPKIASNGDGNHLIVWENRGAAGDGNNDSIFGRIVNGNGVPQGANDFLINSYTTSAQNYPDVVGVGSNYMVVWECRHSNTDDNGYGIYGRLVSGSGTPLLTQFRVNQYTTGNQSMPSIAYDGERVLIVWQDRGTEDTTGIYGRFFSTNGTALTNEFFIPGLTDGGPDRVSVASNGNGFFVTWDNGNLENGSESNGIYGRFVEYNGGSVNLSPGRIFQINDIAGGHQDYAEVVSNGSDYLVLFEDATSYPNISAKYYNLNEYNYKYKEGGSGDFINSTCYAVYLNQNNKDTNYGSEDRMYVESDGTEGKALVMFPDIFGSGTGKIPYGATINSAYLKFALDTTTSGYSTTKSVELYRLTTDWMSGTAQSQWENNVTWNNFGAAEGGVAGTDWNATVVDSIIPRYKFKYHTYDITDTVQYWSTNSTENKGIVLICESTDAAVLYSDDAVDAADKPYLVVSYSAPQPPTAQAGGPYSVNEGSSVTLNGSGTDPRGQGLTYNWDLDYNGSYETTGQNVSFSGTQNGTYTVGLQVTDGGGATDTDTATVTVNNVAPSINNVQMITNNINPGQTATITGNYSDPGSTDSHIVFIDWGQGAALWDVRPASGGSFSVTSPAYSLSGSYSVSIWVEDEDGGSSPHTPFTVYVNYAPTADAGGPYIMNEGSSVTLTGSGTDSEGALTYKWDLDYNGSYETSGQNVSFSKDQNGTFNVTLQVTDEGGLTATDTAVITVNNVLPTVSINNVPGDFEGASITIQYSMMDPGDEGTLAYIIDFGDGDTYSSSLSVNPGQTYNLSTTHVFEDNATYNGSITVTDDTTSNVDTATFTIFNVNPSTNDFKINNISTATSSIYINQNVVISADYSDLGVGDTHVAKVYWGSGDYQSYNISGGSLNITSSNFLSAGTYNCTFYVEDDDGGSSSPISFIINVQIPNTAPTAEAGGPYTVNEGSSVILTGSGTDSEGGLTYSWDLDYNGSYETSGQNVSFSKNQNGTFNVSLQVTDTGGLTDTDIAIVTVLNVAPVVEAGPDMNSDEGDAVSFAGNFTDAGSLDTHTYSWDFGDGSAIVTDTLSPSHIYGQNGSYTAKLTVTDSDGGSAEDTVQVIVTNVAPVVEAGLDKNSDEGDAVSFAGNFTDAGSLDTHTYSWDFGDGSAVVTDTLSPSHIYGQNGSYTAKLTVTDSDGGSAEDTLQVIVTNVAPVVDAGVNLTVNGGETCSFSGSFTDAGTLDTHTYSWDFGDGSAFVTDTLSPSHVYIDSGDYTVILTVTDNNGDSASDTLAVTVQNGAPVLIVDPDFEINEGDTIELVSTSYTDPETGDTHTARIVWGDGDTAEFPVTVGQISVSHRYMNYGDYSLDITVTDDDGASDMETINVKVNRVNIDVSIQAENNLSATISFSAIGGKEYDIFYSDDDFKDFGSTFQWTLADTILIGSQEISGSYNDNGDPDHPGVDGVDGTADDGRLAPYQVDTRYYRVVEAGTVDAGDPWSSEDILFYHTKLLYEGRNYVAQIGVCPNQSLDEIIDSRFLPGGFSMHNSTIVNFWQNNEPKTGYVFTWEDQTSWSDGTLDITNDPVDVGRGMILFIKPGQGMVILPMVGTVCMSDSVDIGLSTGAYSLVRWPYAENMELDNCGLKESGFTGGMTARTSDKIYFWNPVAQKYDLPVFYFTPTGEWRNYDHTPCTRKLNPGEAILIKLGASSGCSTWSSQRKYMKSRRYFEF